MAMMMATVASWKSVCFDGTLDIAVVSRNRHRHEWKGVTSFVCQHHEGSGPGAEWDENPKKGHTGDGRKHS